MHGSVQARGYLRKNRETTTLPFHPQFASRDSNDCRYAGGALTTQVVSMTARTTPQRGKTRTQHQSESWKHFPVSTTESGCERDD